MKPSGNLSAAAALSRSPDSATAIHESVEGILDRLGGNPDIAVVFFTPDHNNRAEEICAELHHGLGPETLIGASASGVIAGALEVEHGPGIAVWAARVPGARAQSFALEFEHSGDGGLVRGWPDVGEEASVVLLADPYSFPLSPFLSSLRKNAKMPSIVGGVVSGGSRPGSNRIIIDHRVQTGGVAGLVMDGMAAVEPLVAQGCCPVGHRFVVTRCEDNVVLELDNQPAYQSLARMLEGLNEEESRRFRHAPQVGLGKVSSLGELGPSGFVIRGVVGIDPDSGAVAVSDQVHDGMALQFHARDKTTAHHQMVDALGLASGLYPEAAGALMFACTGRGEGLFGKPSHDAGITSVYFPDLPVAGMFSAGEIGTVCGMPYIHGFSISMGLLVERE